MAMKPTRKYKAAFLLFILFCIYVVMDARGAEVECKTVQTVEAWHENYNEWIAVDLVACSDGSNFTRPKGLYFVVRDNKMIYAIGDENETR